MSGGELPSVKHKVVLLGDQSVGKTSIVARFMYDSFDQQYQPTIGIDFFSKSIYIEKPKSALQHPTPSTQLPPQQQQEGEEEGDGPEENHNTTTTTTTTGGAKKGEGVVGYNVRLHVWDTAGQERFRSLIPSYIRNSAATIIVYDIASRASFLNAFSWVDDVRGERGCGSSSADHANTNSDAPTPAVVGGGGGGGNPNEEGVVIMLVGNKKDLSIEEREVSTEEAAKKAAEYHCLFTEVSAKTGAGVKSMFREVARALPGPDMGGSNNNNSGQHGLANGNSSVAGGGGGGRNAFLVTPSTMQAGGQGQSGAAAAGGSTCSC